MEDAQRVSCPICMCEFGLSGSQCIGALTYKGQRVEQTLYHLGCISSMLVHCGAMKSGKIQWRPSPVTRREVDGFLQMPWPNAADLQTWIKFVDWQGKGNLEVTDLAFVFSTMIDIDENRSEDFIREKFSLGNENVISETLFANTIFPYLEEHCHLLREARDREVVKSELNGAFTMCTDMRIEHACKASEDYLSGEVQLDKAAVLDNAKFFRDESCRGNRRVISVLGAMLCDSDVDIREAAIIAFEGTAPHIAFEGAAPQGDRHAIEVIWPLLQHELGGVRQAAARVLTAICMPKSQDVISAVEMLLEDRDEKVRAEAVNLLRKMANAQTIGTDFIQRLCSLLEGESIAMIVTALDALAITATKGDRLIMGKVASLTSEQNDDIRLHALLALSKIAERNFESFIDIASQRSQDACPKVRKAVADSLCALGAKGDVKCSALAYSLLSDTSPEVRLGALRAIRKLCTDGDAVAIQNVLPICEDADFHTRQYAKSLLARLVEKEGSNTTHLQRMVTRPDGALGIPLCVESQALSQKLLAHELSKSGTVRRDDKYITLTESRTAEIAQYTFSDTSPSGTRIGSPRQIRLSGWFSCARRHKLKA